MAGKLPPGSPPPRATMPMPPPAMGAALSSYRLSKPPSNGATGGATVSSPQPNAEHHSNYQMLDEDPETRLPGVDFNVGGDKLKILEKVLRKLQEGNKARPSVTAYQGVPLSGIKTPAQIRSAKLMAAKREAFIKNRFDSSGISDTMKRCIRGEDDVLLNDLRLGFPPDSRDPKTGRAILHEACLAGNIHMARMLVTDFKADVTKRTAIGLETPLHFAVLSDNRQLCVTLCLLGADPNARNKQKFTPMFYVKSRRVLKALLQYGCDPLAVNKTGENALEYLTRLNGPDGWDFGMRELLLEAIDTKLRGIHEEKEARRMLDAARRGLDDDDASSLDSSVASLLPAAARAKLKGFQNALVPVKSSTSSPSKKNAKK